MTGTRERGPEVEALEDVPEVDGMIDMNSEKGFVKWRKMTKLETDVESEPDEVETKEMDEEMDEELIEEEEKDEDERRNAMIRMR